MAPYLILILGWNVTSFFLLLLGSGVGYSTSFAMSLDSEFRYSSFVKRRWTVFSSGLRKHVKMSWEVFQGFDGVFHATVAISAHDVV